MSKHTPGPWKFEETDSYGSWFRYDVLSDDGGCVTQVVSWDRHPHEDEDGIPSFANDETAYNNAKLIAAAPDLLEALEAYHHHFGPLSEDQFTNLDAIRCARLASAAIAKAKGEA